MSNITSAQIELNPLNGVLKFGAGMVYGSLLVVFFAILIMLSLTPFTTGPNIDVQASQSK